LHRSVQRGTRGINDLEARASTTGFARELALALHFASTKEKTAMKTIEIEKLATVVGGAGFNTGITGGIKGINNKVPAPISAGHNTGITGGIKGINNKVPATTHQIGHVKLFGNQTLEQMYWDAKPQ
jgi:hypothetical protein